MSEGEWDGGKGTGVQGTCRTFFHGMVISARALWPDGVPVTNQC